MTDLRIRRTEIAIKRSFIDLVNQEGFNAISVTKIAENAMINRLTFYKHYADKYDLAEKLIKSLSADYRQAVEERIQLMDSGLDFGEIIKIMTPELKQVFLNQRDTIKALNTIQIGSLTLQSEIKTIISDNIDQLTHHESSVLEKAITLSLFLTIINYVLEQEKIPNYHEIGQILQNMQHYFS
ncbi:TetR/AcrR family transcriptional regulator [Secundilactobacillus malefermentans]|uniref:TetR/AcrR family transcriptional regulator n=1 Tax=Secundilactobacillus malefermentans TaxID=176292 RepID=UPI0011CB4109|nr:TetR/AcrR family transcriptional regulator [Secundilactobacillus malefermentans]QEA31519.1 TetR/AcrR family transcriptional regulator [Secundilactobacillus malefermentans]